MAGGAALSMATAYLQVSLLLQAALGAWFFGSAESAGAGAAVGVLALIGVARFGCGGQTDLRRAVSARVVVNERGVRLTMLGPQEEDSGGDAVGTATDYALMT